MRHQTTLRGTKKCLHGRWLQETVNARLMGRGNNRTYFDTARGCQDRVSVDRSASEWHHDPLGCILVFMPDVTQILSQIEQGDPSAAEQLLPMVYEELRKLAAHSYILPRHIGVGFSYDF